MRRNTFSLLIAFGLLASVSGCDQAFDPNAKTLTDGLTRSANYKFYACYLGAGLEKSDMHGLDVDDTLYQGGPPFTQSDKSVIWDFMIQYMQPTNSFVQRINNETCWVVDKSRLSALGATSWPGGWMVPVGQLKAVQVSFLNEFNAMSAFGSQSPCRSYSIEIAYEGLIRPINGKTFPASAVMCQDPRDQSWALREFRWT